MATKSRKYQTKKGARWAARWWDPHEEKVQEKGGFEREKDAKAFAALRESELAQGLRIAHNLGKTKVGPWGREFLQSLRGEDRLETKTLDGYYGLWRAQIEPYWGKRSLESIKPIDVQQWVGVLRSKGNIKTGGPLSEGRIRQAYLLFAMMMRAAVENDYLPKSPCYGFKKARKGSVKRAHAKPVLALTLTEVGEAARAAQSTTVLPATWDHGYDFLIWFSVATGLRLGEVRALRRGRCHLQSVARLHGPSLPYVEVVEAVTDVHGKGLDDDDAPLSTSGQSWGDPKSHRARVVYLPQSVADRLLAHLDERVPDDPDALVFTAPKGGVLDPNNLRSQVWEKVREAADIPTSITWHNLRHTCGSLMVASGVSLPDVKEYLGHASLVTTEKYLHALRGTPPVKVQSLEQWLEADVFKSFIPNQSWDEVGIEAESSNVTVSGSSV